MLIIVDLNLISTGLGHISCLHYVPLFFKDSLDIASQNHYLCPPSWLFKLPHLSSFDSLSRQKIGWNEPTLRSKFVKGKGLNLSRGSRGSKFSHK